MFLLRRAASAAPPLRRILAFAAAGGFALSPSSKCDAAAAAPPSDSQDVDGPDAPPTAAAGAPGARSALDFPGEFSQLEEERSFSVYPPDGVEVIMQKSFSSSSSRNEPPAALMTRVGLSPSNHYAIWVLMDQREPTLQAVLTPGQEGRAVRLSSRGRPLAQRLPGLTLEGEAVVAHAGLQQLKLSAKHAGDDWHAQAEAVPLPQGGAPPTFEAQYHQSVAQGASLGGSLQGALISPPRVLASVFGAWLNSRKDTAALFTIAQKPQQGGAVAQEVKLQCWRRVPHMRRVELGANFRAQAPQRSGSLLWAGAPDESEVGVAMRMEFEGHAPNMSPRLTAHVSNLGVASLSLVKPTATNWSETFMRTTIAGVFDHPKRDYKIGCQVEIYF